MDGIATVIATGVPTVLLSPLVFVLLYYVWRIDRSMVLLSAKVATLEESIGHVWNKLDSPGGPRYRSTRLSNSGD